MGVCGVHGPIVAPDGKTIHVASEATVSVELYDDTSIEDPVELLTFHASAGGQSVVAYGFIYDDDPVLTPMVSIDNQWADDGGATDTTMTFTVSLSRPLDDECTIYFHTEDEGASAGVDYGSVSGSVSFSAGQTEAEIPVTVYHDGSIENELDEAFRLHIGIDQQSADDLVKGNTWAYGLIAGTGTAKVYIQPTAAWEIDEQGSDGFMAFNVLLGHSTGTAATITYETEEGTADAGADYDNSYEQGTATGQIVIPIGERDATISVHLNHGYDEPDVEDFTLHATHQDYSASATGLIYDSDDNQPPIAVDDDETIFYEDQDEAIELDVLSNDYDPDGDELIITDLSSPYEGGVAWIDPNGKSIWYRLPADSPTDLELGGEVVIGEEPPESTEGVGTTTDPGGFDAFTDTFQYTITDEHGSTADAFCAATTQNQPEWSVKLKPNYDVASEIGIDGNAGYKILISQEFGANARGGIARPGNQLWQKNVQTAQNVYLDNNGQVIYEMPPADMVLADTTNIIAGSRTTVRATDTLAVKPTPGAAETLFIVQTMEKKLGFNKQGDTLPVPPRTQQPWRPDAEQRATLDQMIGPFLEATTSYIYVDKARIEALHNLGLQQN